MSVDSGLLYQAERYCEDVLIYRFTAGEPEVEPPEASVFLLPDGTAFE